MLLSLALGMHAFATYAFPYSDDFLIFASYIVSRFPSFLLFPLLLSSIPPLLLFETKNTKLGLALVIRGALYPCKGSDEVFFPFLSQDRAFPVPLTLV